MPYEIDDTHDPKLESWIESANDPETDFPIQNLPLGLIRVPDADDPDGGSWHEFVVTRIGDTLVNLSACVYAGVLKPEDDRFTDDFEVYIGDGGPLNSFGDEDATPGFRLALRRAISSMLRKDNPILRDNRELRDEVLIDPADAQHIPPLYTLDYTDFYASVYHATNVGSMFRPDNPLLPNYKHIPVGYHGRASSIVPSGADIRRPIGQQAPAEEGGSPAFGPCKMLDYELEVGVVMGRSNDLGEPISLDDAEDHILGLCLVNDWSARDIQKWEYQPLGPFLAKNFATTVSPYLVTMEALAPFRSPAYERPAGDPQPLSYLDSDHNRSHGGIDLTLEVHLASAEMRKKGMAPIRLSKGSFRDMYWTIAQMVAHHTVNGCNLQPGDLLASGTVSGPTRDARGCLLELTWDGDPFANPPKLVPGTQRTPIKLPTGETRKFLEDGDEVILKGYCQREGFRRIGFGECRGIITPARAL
ncbi:MAG: fumarylacetoacetase [Phycisphaerales bacterium JB037]